MALQKNNILHFSISLNVMYVSEGDIANVHFNNLSSSALYDLLYSSWDGWQGNVKSCVVKRPNPWVGTQLGDNCHSARTQIFDYARLTLCWPSLVVFWGILKPSDLSFSSCSRRSCSSLSLCSRACLRFSARMRAASSGSLVPAMGLADGEGAGDAAGTEGAEWTGSGGGEAAVVVAGVPGAWGEAAAEDSTMAGTTGEPKTGKINVTEETITHRSCAV